MKIEQVARALKSVGACFAGSTGKYVAPTDGYDAKPSYHVHPVSSNPDQASIVTFDTMQEIMSYVRARKAAARATTEKSGIDIMDAFWASR